MRAILNAARIQNLFRRERVSLARSVNGAVFPAGRTVGAGLLDCEDRTCKPVRRLFDFCRLTMAAGRLFHALLNVCQDAKRGLSKKFPSLSGVVAHVEQPTEGQSSCQTRGGAETYRSGAQ
jgi:hypothetical protein